MTLWTITIFNGKTHYNWPFSIAFCMFSRGYGHHEPLQTPRRGGGFDVIHGHDWLVGPAVNQLASMNKRVPASKSTHD